jgi:hypothetical protein
MKEIGMEAVGHRLEAVVHYQLFSVIKDKKTIPQLG